MKTQTPRSLYPMPLGASERRQLGLVLPLLSRPELDAAQEEALRAIGAGLAEPLPLLPSLFPLEPLFRHHALRAEVEPGRLFRATETWPPPPFRVMAEAYYERTAVLREVGAEFERRGVRSGVLLKGVVLAEAWPSPALRHMCDVDLAITPEEKPLADEALAACGLWRVRTPSGIGWRWSATGCLDIQVPGTRLAGDMMETATPPEEWARGTPRGLRVPAPPHHLLLMSLHTAQHRGTRLWRDVCDVRALLRHHPNALAEAHELVLEHDRGGGRGGALLPQFLAFSEFLRRHAGETNAPSLADGTRMGTRSSRQAAALLRLYQQMAFDPVPPVFMSLLRRTRRLPGQLLRPGAMLRGLLRRRSGLSSAASCARSLSEGTDPILGRVPDSGSAALHLLKARLLLGLFLGGSGAHYRRLLKVDRAASSFAKPFRAPME